MRWAALVILLLASVAGADEPVVVGAKTFTESVILSEIARGGLEEEGVEVESRGAVGGSTVVFEALQFGDLDVYAEYTGTLLFSTFATLGLETEGQLRAELARRGIRMTARLGFNNTYGVGVMPETAERYGLRSISDLAEHPELRFGLTNEYVSRDDGWPALREAYGLEPDSVLGLEHDLAYVALQSGQIDAMDVYTTDAEIAEFGLVVLEDDRSHFPVYDAVLLYRADLGPEAAAALEALGGTIDEASMIEMNRRVKIGRESEAAVAAGFIGGRGSTEMRAEREGVTALRLWQRTAEHLALVGISMALALLISVPLGVWAYKAPRIGWAVLGAVGVIQTIPSLAVLVLMIPLLGIGAKPAIAALFLYALLPIVRNTHAGLAGIPRELSEVCEALDLSKRRRLLSVELPLASRSIVAGVKTSLVLTIGFATLGALIGAGGYGQPILEGIRLADTALILEGALPAAGMALAAQGLMGLAELAVVPRGLRIKPAD